MKQKNYIHNNDGATAVEFAFFAIPFVFILIGMIEIGMMSTAATLLQGGTDEAGRLIRTGQAQNSGDPQAAFEDELCATVGLLINCDDLVYEVIEIDEDDGFSGAAANIVLLQPALDEDGNMEAGGFDPGNENSLVLVRAAYRYPLMTPFVAPFLSDGTDGKRLLIATTIIQNEPYDF
ncbi:MAG: pilus assembly protein TadE [Alphaproteobacteria bacterium]|nr:MAG: pilus assembly protein TadE [Alphaproteobacteria bacterium]